MIGFVRRMATVYTITNRRLNIKRGIIARDIQETRLERVQNVSYSQTAFERMLNVGDVDFDTASDAENTFVFSRGRRPPGRRHRGRQGDLGRRRRLPRSRRPSGTPATAEPAAAGRVADCASSRCR